MTKRIITALLASLLAVAGLASPARASASDCAASTFCIWTSTGFAGSRYQFTR
jgi:hypothetical protein